MKWSFTRLFIIVSALSLSGCSGIAESIYKSINNSYILSGPARFTFTKEYLNANGYFFSIEEGGVRFQLLELFLSEETSEFRNDIWVQIHCGEKTKLALLTPQLLKENSYKEMFSPEKTRKIYYSDNSGISFEFDPNGLLIGLSANSSLMSTLKNTSNENPRIGSFLSGKSLALPCSVPELESVFGKPDKLYSSRPN